MVQFAVPSFSGLPEDASKKIDAYTETSPELKNELTSKITAFGVSSDSLIEKSLKVVKGIGSKIANNGMDLNQARLRIQDALKGSRSAITGLATDLERSIMGEITGTDEGTGYVRKSTDMLNSVKMLINAKEYYFGDGSISSVNNIIGFMGDLSNNSIFKVFDLGAEAALLKGIIEEVTAWGIPDLIDETFGAKWNGNSYDYDYNAEFRFSVVKRVSATISPSTDLATIERLITHGGATALIADNPNFPAQLLQNYVFPEGTIAGGPYPTTIPDPNFPEGPAIPNPDVNAGKESYADQLRRLEYILNLLKPDWFETRRNGLLVWNLYFINAASEDAITLLCSNEKYVGAMLTTPFYRIENPLELIKQYYPDAAL